MKLQTHKIGDQVFDIFVGTNSKENWEIIDGSGPDDLWFHVEDLPSGHVIIREQFNKSCNFDPIYPNQIISIAANLCKCQSKYKDRTKLKIIYTQISNIKKGKEIGSVLVSKSQYIFI